MAIHEQLQGLLPALHGWCTAEKAAALCDLVLQVKPQLVVEVGTWGGKSLFPQLLALKQNGSGRAICIDPWSPEASAEGQTDPDSEKWWGSQNHELVYQSFLYHLRKLGLDSIVEIHREKSSDMIPPEQIEILHLDGNHGPEALEDAERFAPNVKLGGYCILDDLDWSGGYVRMAEKFIKSIGFVHLKAIGTGAIYQRVEMGAPKIAEKASDPRSPLPTVEQALDSQITVAMITSREKPCIEWFLDSLKNTGLQPAQIIIVDLFNQDRPRFMKVKWPELVGIVQVDPKPTVWQGKHRLTKENWWAASNARNTAICLCKTEWLAVLDDRCVIMPGYAEAVRDAMKGNYVMCGSYQKRIEMQVENGLIKHGGTIIGEDHRFQLHPSGVYDCPGDWTFGCNTAFPIKWALEINGWEELMDGLSFEDCFFGRMMQNCGHPIKFDARARIIEDRTPSELGQPMHRTSKEKHPNDTTDKGHAAVRKFSPLKRTLHPWNLAEIREKVLAGGDWPDVSGYPSTDWFDGEPIKDFVWPWVKTA